MRVLYFFLSSFLFTSVLIAQPFQKKVFGVNEGLASHLIKATQFDSLGYLWIGTDEGLVRYDGREFLAYPNATPSRFIKRIQTINGKLWVVSDLGVTQIDPGVDSVHFTQLFQGARSINDSTLWYPKDIYTQGNGYIWITEPGCVVRLVDGGIKRYAFPKTDLSSSFFRSFSLFEFNDTLYVLSFTGSLYQYNQANDRFQLVEYESEKKLIDIYQVTMMNDEVLIGDAKGMHSLTFSEGTPSIRFIDSFGLRGISVIKKYQQEELIIGDFGDELLVVSYPDFEVLRREKVFRANGISITAEKNIWVSSDEGLVLLKRNFFDQMGQNNPYVESIVISDSMVYYCHKDAVLRIFNKERLYYEQPVFEEDDSYFLFLKKHKDDLWVSNKWKIIRLNNHEKVEEIDLSSRGLFIFNFEFDDEQNIWLCQDNVPGLLKIDRERKYHEYQSDKGLDVRVLIVKRINDKLYVGGSGSANYLYIYDEDSDKFKNISLPVTFESKSNLEVNDITGRGDTLWLATTVGVFQYYDQSIEQLNIGTLSDLPVKSVALEDNYLWFSNTYGIVRKDLTKDDSFLLFDENSGLNSRSGNSRALKIDRNKTKLIGTAKGISYSVDENESFRITSKPILSSVEVNAQRISRDQLEQEKISHGSFVKFTFLSLTLPGESLEYQYKETKSTNWTDLGTSNFVQIPNIYHGNYSFLVRAKQKGNYLWSEPVAVQFKVDYPIYEKWWFVFLMLLIISSMAYLMYKVNNIRMKRASDKLKVIVDDRTNQLLKTNKELIQTNKELDMFVYSASHDLKAPLASLKGLLSLYNHEDDAGKRHLINMMRINVSKLDDFIGDVLEYSKNSRTELTYEPVDFNSLITDILTSYQYMDKTDKVEVKVNVEDNAYRSDKNRLRIILNNLISNSIRYSDMEKAHSYLNINIRRENGEIVLDLEDNGLGIEETHLKKVFDMFYRANDSSVGSGLGLYIVKEAVDTLSGKIMLESQYGKGSKFRILIPDRTES